MNQRDAPDNVSLKADSFVSVSAVPREVWDNQELWKRSFPMHVCVKRMCIMLVAREEDSSWRHKMGNILNKASHAHHSAGCQDQIIPVNKEWWTLHLTDHLLHWNCQQCSFSYCWFCFTTEHISKIYKMIFNFFFLLENKFIIANLHQVSYAESITKIHWKLQI